MHHPHAGVSTSGVGRALGAGTREPRDWRTVYGIEVLLRAGRSGVETLIEFHSGPARAGPSGASRHRGAAAVCVGGYRVNLTDLSVMMPVPVWVLMLDNQLGLPTPVHGQSAVAGIGSTSVPSPRTRSTQ